MCEEEVDDTVDEEEAEEDARANKGTNVEAFASNADNVDELVLAA